MGVIRFESASRRRLKAAVSVSNIIFSRPDYTVGAGISPVQSKARVCAPESRALTAGWDSRRFYNIRAHPAPKIYVIL
jgi:hypothetical protein